MFSIFKKNKDQGVPGWASFFTAKEYQTFIELVTDYFNKLNTPFKMENGVIEFEEGNPLGFQSLGLGNLAQNCKQSALSDYKEIIAHHFGLMTNSLMDKKEFEDIADDFEQVKQFIALRIYDDGYASHVGKENVIGFELAEHLYAVLVFDLPETIAGVQPTYLDKWGKTKEELFSLGIQNVRTNYEFPLFKEKIDGIDFYAVITDHFFSPNIYFDLNNQSELLGVYGSVIAFPHRHTTLIYPIDTMNVVKVLHHLASMAYGMNVEGPGSITNKLYWYNNNKLEEIVYGFEENTISITPSEGFVAMLNTLGDNEENKALN